MSRCMHIGAEAVLGHHFATRRRSREPVQSASLVPAARLTFSRAQPAHCDAVTVVQSKTGAKLLAHRDALKLIVND